MLDPEGRLIRSSCPRSLHALSSLYMTPMKIHGPEFFQALYCLLFTVEAAEWIYNMLNTWKSTVILQAMWSMLNCAFQPTSVRSPRRFETFFFLNAVAPSLGVDSKPWV